MQRGEVWRGGGEGSVGSRPGSVARHPTQGASRTPPPTVGCVTGRREQPREEWRTVDGAPYGAEANQQPPAWPGAMPRSGERGHVGTPQPPARPVATPRQRRAGLVRLGTWFDSGGRWVVEAGLRQ